MFPVLKVKSYLFAIVSVLKWWNKQQILSFEKLEQVYTLHFFLMNDFPILMFNVL